MRTKAQLSNKHGTCMCGAPLNADGNCFNSACSNWFGNRNRGR